jgi:F-type H+-transporting ATPase subunit a
VNKLVGFVTNLVQNPRRRNITLGVIVLLAGSIILKPLMSSPHVSLAAEPLLEHGPSWLTNSLLTTLIVDIILIALALATRAGLKEGVPSGLVNVMEMIIEGLYGLVENVVGKNAKRFFPVAATIFLFVIVSNYSGLIPGVGSIGLYHGAEKADGGHGLLIDQQVVAADEKVAFSLFPAEEEGHVKFVPLLRAPSADLNVTFALALITMALVQYYGISALGRKYFKKFFNFGGKGFMGAIFGVVGILELISEIAKIISFAFRLFGNIFAGEVLLAVMAFLVAFLLPMPFYGLELFVGFIQAFVFMMLAVVFFSTAMVGHDDHH